MRPANGTRKEMKKEQEKESIHSKGGKAVVAKYGTAHMSKIRKEAWEKWREERDAKKKKGKKK